MYRYLLQDRAEAGRCLSVKTRHLRRHIGLHWHDYIELELIVGGQGQQSINGRMYEAKRGCLSLLRLTDFHELTPEPEMQILNLAVDDSLLSEELLRRLTSGSTLIFTLAEKETQILERLLWLCREENTHNFPNMDYLKHLLSCVLLRVLALVPEEDTAPPPVEKPMQAALLHLHMHFRENPSLATLAAIAHYNASHFSTTFHKTMGMTYIQYLNMLKTDYAKKLLTTTDVKIADICQECGFTSHSNFLRLFRQQTGLSPALFRKQHRTQTSP